MPALIARRHTLHILDVQKEQPIVILPNSTSRIAAALLIVGDIEFKFDVARIGRLHDPIHFIGRFAQAAHVIVIADRHAQIDGSLADFS